jgi:hypothetical protein
MAAHAYYPRFLGGGDQEVCGLKHAWAGETTSQPIKSCVWWHNAAIPVARQV